MEVNENGFVNTPMPLVFFDHSAEHIPGTMGITARRDKEIKREIEDLFDPAMGGKKYKKTSQQIEAALTVCKNEQERLYVMSQMGKAHMKGEHHIQIMGEGADLPDEIKKAIMKKIRGHFGKSDDETQD